MESKPGGEWQAEDVARLIANPTHSYGKLLQSSDTVADHVQRLNQVLAEKQKSLGQALTLAELDEEYTATHLQRGVAAGAANHHLSEAVEQAVRKTVIVHSFVPR